ncbi:similar to flavin-containing amine oxidasedehydrogenase [Plenodomus lingam JN3]|uniref:Similar to flavin-containing amine oxidasedehydrogenase n=2 Tax=Leptosphaeria maculans TaxID=5022 RepID=E4ZTN6_LEPMJ|nr:similar to flavin-containing amine oxidasedehydrogenase [Plenodomus lingam JN3]CBX94892.1 similar to flavin-containing amine oxidasedehydrogenase [Plenodomus lingam JN3]
MAGGMREGKKRVLVVGAGAAGMSCAHHLSEHPDKFDVTLIDAVDYCGGQAFSIDIDKERHGASWLNQGVQGGSYIFHHTLTMFARQGHHADPVDLQVSFGKDTTFWTNVFPTEILARHQKEIRKFNFMLKVVRWFELFFALIPIKILFKLFFFSDEFTNTVAMPMIALFLGTGNETPNVPSIILERLCTSPTYGMWYPPDKKSIVSNMPPMVVFPRFSEFYETWRRDLVKRGVNVRLSTEITEVVSRDKKGVVVKLIKRTPVKDGHNPNSAWVPYDDENNADKNAAGKEEHYDELVLCVLADTANRLLKKTSTLRERRILSTCKFSDDVTITHHDSAYMQRHYENFYTPSLATQTLSSTPQTSRLAFAAKNFKPMYYIKMYAADATKLEMSFDCTNYQSQFPPEVPFDAHVFQTIYLNKARDGHLWSIDEIDSSKIIRTDWWHQLCHSWTHYAFVVPWIMWLQGRRHTRFAAAWTLLNAHEVAVMSGIAAAVDLGAQYPEDLERDRFALLCFRLYYLLAYGKWYRRRVTRDKRSREGVGSDWASGWYGSVYRGPGVGVVDRQHWRDENGIEGDEVVYKYPVDAGRREV